MHETSNWAGNGCPYCAGAYRCKYTPENPLGCYAHRIYQLYHQVECRMKDRLGNLHDDTFLTDYEHRAKQGS